MHGACERVSDAAPSQPLRPAAAQAVLAEMVASGVQPTPITFNALISSCVRASQTEQACALLQQAAVLV